MEPNSRKKARVAPRRIGMPIYRGLRAAFGWAVPGERSPTHRYRSSARGESAGITFVEPQTEQARAAVPERQSE